MENFNINEAFAIVKNHQLGALKKIQLEKLKKEQKIKTGLNFEFRMVFNHKKQNGSFVEYFNMEGYENSISIFEQYRKIGFDIDLKYMELHLIDDEKIKVKGLKFNY